MSYGAPIRDGHKLTVTLGPDYRLVPDIQCPGCDHWRPEHAAEREKEPCWLRSVVRSVGAEFLEWWPSGGEPVALDGPIEIEWWVDDGDPDEAEIWWRPVTPQPLADDTHPCADCGQPYFERLGGHWLTSDAMWARVVGDETIALCPRCFTERARAAGLTVSWFAREG